MEAYMGLVMPFAFPWAPQGFATCTGTQLNINQNSALFALIGTYFGGNGTTTFNLPDLRGRLPIGQGQQPGKTLYNIGNYGGNEQIALTAAQVPLAAHTHPATFTPSGNGGSANLSVSTAAASAAAPTLTNGQTAYLANAAAGSAGNALKGLYTTTAPAQGAIASIPVNGGGGSGGTVAVGNNTVTPPSAAVGLMNPFLALNFCICTIGLFPSCN
jgi:microcystin-dependent protein